MQHSASRRTLGPIELEVIHGTIRAAELEIEAAVERTSRSPMIRDQHDYRVALFDAKGRKLTGRSYSAIVEPVFEYFGADDIHPGDVFFWNDPYNSSGGIGHVPDLCTTVPIFYGDRLIGFSQVFGHHDDVGGSVPGSLPVHATDSWMEGLLVPPIKLYERGKRNEAAFRIIVRNSRLSEHLKGDLDAEQGAARLGCRRIEALAQRYGVETLEQAFDQILENTAAIFRREILPKIKDGVYHFEDYIEADGVDEPRLHTLRLTMTKTRDKILLDFTGTDPEAKGPINWALDEADGRYFRKWLAPTLRSLAATPERAAEIDSNEGVLDVIEVKFPPKGSLITPHFGRPTGMRFFLMLRSLGAFAACLSKATGGAMPADHETIRIWGLSGGKTQDDFFLFREVLGGGGPGRPWADGSDVVHVVPNSRNLPAEFAETRYPVLVEQLGLKQDSGGAGYRRGGFGYDKRIRTLDAARLISNADRSTLGCYGVNGGKAGQPYAVAVTTPDGETARLSGHDRHGDRAARLISAHRHYRRRRLGRPAAARSRDGGLRRAMRPDLAGKRHRGLWRRAHESRAQVAGRSRQDRAAPPPAREPARQSADVRSRPAFRRAKAPRPSAISGGLERSGCRLVRDRRAQAGRRVAACSYAFL